MCAFSKIFSQQTITTTVRHTKMAQATTYSFEAKIASVDIISTRVLHGLLQRKAMKYKLRSKEIKIKSKLILTYVQYAAEANILISRKQLGISQEKVLDMYISSLRKKKTGSLERFFLLSIGHHQYRQDTWKSH